MQYFTRTTHYLKRVFAIGLLTAALYLASPCLTVAAPADLDTTFGNGGIVNTLGSQLYFASTMAIQSDGKIIAAGEGAIGFSWDFAVVRYNTDGSLDNTFGGTGIVLTSIGDSHDGARSVAIQDDGKIVVAGYSYTGGFAVVRYNTNGSLDTSFNGTGIVTTSVGATQGLAYSVAVQPNGKIVAAGYGGNGFDYDFALVRYDSDGSLDTSFNGGIVITPIGNSLDVATSVAVQADGKIVASGQSYTDPTGSGFAIVRYTASGLLDTTFNGTGIVVTSFGNAFSRASDIAVQLDGKIVAAGQSDGYSSPNPAIDFALVRYNPGGSLDTSFGDTGKVIIPVGNSHDFAYSLALQSNGKIVAAGASFTGADTEFALARVNPDGSLDTTFNGTGKLITVTANANGASSVAVQSDGKIVAAGGQNDEIFGFTLVRYQGDPPPTETNGKIAFTSNRDGNHEIYLMNTDGTDQKRLTNNVIVDDHPTWSPNGKRLAFVSQRASGAFAIFQMNMDGTNKVEITPLSEFVNVLPSGLVGFSMSWSPDGRKITFQDPYYNDIWVVDVETHVRQNLTNDGGSTTALFDFNPVWSPDGSKIMYASPRYNGACSSLYTIKPDGTDRSLISGNHCPAYSPSWSPDGKQIVFVNLSGETFTSHLRIAKSDGTAVRVFEGGYPGPDPDYRDDPRWSPDGRKIAFSLRDTQDIEIYVKNIDGGGRIQLTNTTGFNYRPSWRPPARSAFDFDGDGRSDISVFRPTDGVWYLDRSAAGFAATQFGVSTDKVTPADYDGDGKTDISVYRNGTWYWLNSSNSSLGVYQFGLSDDIPVPADYTGDGRSELAIYRGGAWWTLDLSNYQTSTILFGLITDEPVVADYDGDGRADQAIYRNGEWHINRSSSGYAAVQFGLPADKPVVGDYDGDGKADQGVYRDGTWYLNRSQAGVTSYQWGLPTDIPAPADYDGDGKTDAVVYRDGVWYLLQSTSGFEARQFGLAEDQPVPAAYLQ